MRAACLMILSVGVLTTFYRVSDDFLRKNTPVQYSHFSYKDSFIAYRISFQELTFERPKLLSYWYSINRL